MNISITGFRSGTLSGKKFSFVRFKFLLGSYPTAFLKKSLLGINASTLNITINCVCLHIKLGDTYIQFRDNYFLLQQ